MVLRASLIMYSLANGLGPGRYFVRLAVSVVRLIHQDFPDLACRLFQFGFSPRILYILSMMSIWQYGILLILFENTFASLLKRASALR